MDLEEFRYNKGKQVIDRIIGIDNSTLFTQNNGNSQSSNSASSHSSSATGKLTAFIAQLKNKNNHKDIQDLTDVIMSELDVIGDFDITLDLLS